MSKKVSGKYNKSYCGKVIISTTNSNMPHHKKKRIRHKVVIKEKTLWDYIKEFIILFWG